MRRAAIGTANRIGLLVVGVLGLSAGMATVWLGISRLNHRVADWTGLQLPAAGVTVFAPDAVEAALASAGVASLIGFGGLLLGLLGLTWLLYQLPRINRQPDFQLHDDARTGLIRCGARVISRALEERIEQLPGVTGAAVTVGGTAAHPRVAVNLGVDQRSELPGVTQAVIDRVAADLATTLETRIDHLAVRVQVGGAPTRDDHLAVVAGTRPSAAASVPG